MALADTAKLAVDLSLTGNFTSGLAKAQSQLGKFNTSVSTSVSKMERLGQGIGTGIRNIAKIGAVAAAGIGAFVVSGVQDLATLEDATTKVDGAIKQMGLTGKVTAAQVADWSNQIEASVQAAFDDKDITAATATLIRFGAVTQANLKPAMVVMTDLAARTGDVGSAANLLGKALADPTKAAGRLARAGVVLTKAQDDQIKSLVKAGKVEQAQALLLDLISKKTKGAAAATAGPYRDALNELRDASEDARKALAIGFLPIIERVANWLHTKLADPAVIAQIKDFGKTLADGFDKLLGIAGKIPWDSVAAAFKIAGTASKAILDAFVSMPSWVQTAVLTGWGLNKLTGGALTDIFGSLASGLIKGILHMNAGVVNITAANVTGGGGVPGAAGAAGGLGAITAVLALGSVAALEVGIAGAIGGWLKANVPGWGTPGGAAQVGPVVIGGESESQRLHRIVAEQKAADDLRAASAALAKASQATNNVQPGAILDRGGREQGFNVLAGKIRDDANFIADTLRAISVRERAAIEDLKHSSDPKKVADAIKAVEEIMIQNGHGSLEATRQTAAAIREQLKHTHDPTLQAALRKALKDVEGKIPGREYAQRELAKADKIIKGTGSVADKIKGLQAIENDLKNHKLPGQTKALQSKIDQLKASQKAADAATTRAIKEKDLSLALTVNNSTKVVVNSRSVFAQQRSYTRYSNPSSAGPGK